VRHEAPSHHYQQYPKRSPYWQRPQANTQVERPPQIETYNKPKKNTYQPVRSQNTFTNQKQPKNESSYWVVKEKPKILTPEQSDSPDQEQSEEESPKKEKANFYSAF
jgi:hypothetical protein